jgi:hypothetical protein
MKRFAFIVFVVFIASSLSAQTTSILTQGNIQWEYLVICLGKAYFSEPQKLLAYPEIDFASAEEATNIQDNLDKLGKYGWEVTNIVGQIGGDQEIVLKRIFNVDRSKEEANVIQKKKEDIDKINQELQKGIDATKDGENAVSENNDQSTITQEPEIQEIPKIELVDLDKLEEEKKKESEKNELKNSIIKLVQTSLLGNQFELDVTINDEITVTLVFDGTTKFLHENTYRASEVESFMNEICVSIKSINFNTDKKIWVHLQVNATFQNENVEIGYTSMLGSRFGDDFSWFQ